MPTMYTENKAKVNDIVLDVTCAVCNISFKVQRKHLSTSHVSNDGKRPGVFFTFQCPFCLTWHTEVGLYKTISDGLKE